MTDTSDRNDPGPSGVAALDLAARGWSVVPVHSVAGNRCSCGRVRCPSPGKHPRVRWERFTERAATPVELADWWARWPDANVGVVTGWVSRVIVLDVDPRNGGDDALAALETDHGALPETVTSRTGGRGRHLWFAHPAHLVPSRPLAPGLDLKAEGGMVVVPPSRHMSGDRYRWAAGRAPGDRPLARLPRWLEERSVSLDAGPGAVPRPPMTLTASERAAFAALWEEAGVALAATPTDARGEVMVRCPFHDDHHPSLHIDADGCRWFCFGCRRGGGVRALHRLVHPGSVTGPDAPRPAFGEPVGVPTLRPDVTVEVVGESTHQDVLLDLAGGQRTWSGAHRRVLAHLVPDPDNPFDRNAVSVWIDGRPVGHLPRTVAAGYHPLITAADADRGEATCLAEIRGGWERGHGDVGRFGVVLQLPRLP